jgi:hypothetical protein
VGLLCNPRHNGDGLRRFCSGLIFPHEMRARGAADPAFGADYMDFCRSYVGQCFSSSDVWTRATLNS